MKLIRGRVLLLLLIILSGSVMNACSADVIQNILPEGRESESVPIDENKQKAETPRQTQSRLLRLRSRRRFPQENMLTIT